MQKRAFLLSLLIPLFCFNTTASAASNSEKCTQLTSSGESELGRGNLTAASKLLEQAVDICNQSPEKSARPYIAFGKLAYERKNLSEAIKWFKRALQDEPDLPLAYMNISAAYYQLKDLENAAEYGVKAVASAEKHLDEYEEASQWAAKSAYNVGLAYVALGGDKNDVSYAKKAEPYFLKTAQYLPDYNQTYYQLGIIKEAAYQDFKAAASYYKKSCDMGYTHACDWGAELNNRIPQYESNGQAESDTKANTAKKPRKKH